MNADQMATYEMLHAVKEYGDLNTAKWGGSVPFSNAFNLFKTRLAVLDGYLPQQQNRPAGQKAARKAAKNSQRESVTDLVGGLRAYGYDKNLTDVQKKANYSPHDIERLTTDDLASVAENLHEYTDKLLTPATSETLKDYGITADTQAALAGNITTLTGLKGTVKAMTASATDATAQIALLLTELTGIAHNRLDNAASLLRKTEPDFVAQYFIVRRVDDAAHATMAMTILVKDEAGAPVANASVTLSNGLKRKTTEKGACQILHLPDGTYTVTVRKEGWEEVTQQASTTKGETAHVEVVLEKK